jgi:hypothetical protein
MPECGNDPPEASDPENNTHPHLLHRAGMEKIPVPSQTPASGIVSHDPAWQRNPDAPPPQPKTTQTNTTVIVVNLQPESPLSA